MVIYFACWVIFLGLLPVGIRQRRRNLSRRA